MKVRLTSRSGDYCGTLEIPDDTREFLALPAKMDERVHVYPPGTARYEHAVRDLAVSDLWTLHFEDDYD